MVGGAILVIGAGSIGRRHAGNLEKLGARAELCPWRSFDVAAVRLRQDIAGVVIATATQIRLELIELCAARNWPFYVEKPLAWLPAQVDALYRAAAPVATRSMIGFMMRYHPAVTALAARDLSQIYRFHLEIGHDVRQWRANWRFADSYAALPQGGGVLLDLCHELDLAKALFPDLALSAVDCLGHTQFPGVDVASQVTLVAKDGPTGLVAMDYLCPISLRRASLIGLNEVIDLDWMRPAMYIRNAEGSQTEVFAFDRNDMFLAAMADFLALAAGAAPSANRLIPRFDLMRGSCDLVAAAWAARRFHGQCAVAME